MTCKFLCCFRCLCGKPEDDEFITNNDSDESRQIASSVIAAPLLERLPIVWIKKYSILAWGLNSTGALGLGKSARNTISLPTEIQFSYSVVSISCGAVHTLFILEDGTVYSCGLNDCGQLGHDDQSNSLHMVKGLEGFIISAKAGFAHNLAIDSTGKLYTWGSNSHGQLGIEIKTNKKFIKQPHVVTSLLNKTVIQVAVGQFHSVVLTNVGEIYTCGLNSHGQLGLDPNITSSQRKFDIVHSLLGFPAVLVTAGGFHSLALSVSGAVCSWGKNNCGQLGIGDTTDKWRPTYLKTLKSVYIKYITAGLEHTAFLTQDGGLFTCGNGTCGQLGHDSYSNAILPRKVLEFGSVVSQIACGHSHTVCLNENKLYYFGLDASGVLGTNHEKLNSPKHILIKDAIHSIFTGGQQCFLLVRAQTNENEAPTVINCDYRVLNTIGILTITEDCTDKIVSASETLNASTISFAKLLFSSPSCWNASFLANDGKHCSSKNVGVDLERVDAAFSKLNGLKSQEVKKFMDDLIYNDLLKNLPSKIENKEMLRVFVLIPRLPSFYSVENELSVVHFSQKILLLPSKMMSTVVKWLYYSPMDHILQLISLYKKTIVSILGSMEYIEKDDMCKTCLSILSKLYNLNKTSLRLSYHTFIIPQLSKIDVAKDYLKWLQKFSFSFCDYPFVFDERAKTTLLQIDQAVQMKGAITQAAAGIQNGLPMLQSDSFQMSFLLLNVNRNNLVEDVITQLQYRDTNELKKPIRIKFVGEEAEDAGGVRKEFFLLLLSEILDAKFGMFTHYNESRLMWFNGNSFENSAMYSLIGIMCGLAIYNCTIINLPFPLALYKKILDEKVDLSDLKELNPTVGRSLEQIVDYAESDLDTAFSLNFEVAQESYGEVTSMPLKKGGSNISVTQENKEEFVELYVNHVFNNSAQQQFNAFKEGFERVCGSHIMQLFHPTELQAMVTGNEDYIWGELEENCTYGGFYYDGHSVIKRFWLVFHSLTEEEKKQFLLFLTGSDRIPIAGMKELKMVIQPLADVNYLPVAHTCFDLLDLPPYHSEEIMKSKLIQAIQQYHGFSLI